VDDRKDQQNADLDELQKQQDAQEKVHEQRQQGHPQEDKEVSPGYARMKAMAFKRQKVERAPDVVVVKPTVKVTLGKATGLMETLNKLDFIHNTYLWSGEVNERNANPTFSTAIWTSPTPSPGIHVEFTFLRSKHLPAFNRLMKGDDEFAFMDYMDVRW
jgi:hypothetical protein